MSKATVMEYFTMPNGEYAYNTKCMACICLCKQSYRTSIVVCPNYAEKK